ncbi:MAG: IS481 family transposase [Ilumatobacteraceae bacterium]
MVRKVTSMKAMAAVVAVGAGQRINVTRVCAEVGVSRKTFYKWVARYRAEGLDGLEERSRRPNRISGQTAVEVEEVIVRLRKELADAGLDHGATTIQWHLGRRKKMLGGNKVPSVATVHRILVRRGLVTPSPSKRPKTSWCRFEAPAPNEWWQIDAMGWVTARGKVEVFNVVDDHSRVAMRSRAVVTASGEQAWTTFAQAAQQWGFPAGCLSDNGLCFSGKLRGYEVLFEQRLRAAGVRPFTGRPYHPQTTGKVERFQQTLKKWLRRQPLAADLAELQAQLDEFCSIYNHQRPHQGIGRVTPVSRWQATPAAQPAATPINAPTWPPVSRHSVVANGVVFLDDLAIHIGAEWTGCDATIVVDGVHASVFIADQLLRHLRIDPTRRYQPSGRPRGGRRQPRHLPS